jgi:hypothetical protein
MESDSRGSGFALACHHVCATERGSVNLPGGRDNNERATKVEVAAVLFVKPRKHRLREY